MIPDFRLILFAVALMPMVLHQASSLSADALTIAMSFLFVAVILRLSFDEGVRTLRTQEYVLVAFITLGTMSCKFNLWMLLLLLLIPGQKFPNRSARWVFITGCTMLSIGVTAMWQWANQANMLAIGMERARPRYFDPRKCSRSVS